MTTSVKAQPKTGAIPEVPPPHPLAARIAEVRAKGVRLAALTAERASLAGDVATREAEDTARTARAALNGTGAPPADKVLFNSRARLAEINGLLPKAELLYNADVYALRDAFVGILPAVERVLHGAFKAAQTEAEEVLLRGLALKNAAQEGPGLRHADYLLTSEMFTKTETEFAVLDAAQDLLTRFGDVIPR